MHRKQLLDLIEKSGSVDGETLIKIKAASPADGAKLIVDAVNLSGMSESDVEVALGTKPTIKTVTLSVEADDGEEVKIKTSDDDEDSEEKMAEDDEEMGDDGEKVVSKSLRKSRRAPSQKSFAAASSVFGEPGAAPSFASSSLGRAVKKYDNALRAGRKTYVPGYGEVTPGFSSGEEAAVYGAWMRDRLVKMYPVELSQYASADDRELLTKSLGQKAHGTGTNALGGATVPVDFSADVIDLPSEYGAYRRACGVTSMSRDQLMVPRVRNRFVVGDIGENLEATSQDNPTFDNVNLVAAKKGGIIRISNELLNDTAVSLGEIIARDIERGFDKYIDDSALLGSNGYSGMAAANFTVSGTDYFDAGLSSSWSELTITQIEQWLGLIPSPAWSAGGVGIICHRAFFGAVLARFGASAAGVSDSGRGLFDSTVPLASGNVANYRGLPVYMTDSMPSAYAGNQVIAVAGSFFGGCKYGEVTGSTEITTSDQRYFEYDQIGFRALRRLAINNHNVGGNDSSKPSVVVGLVD